MAPTTLPPEEAYRAADVRAGVAAWLFKYLALLAATTAALFLAAGTTAWRIGWAVPAVIVVQVIGTVAVLLPRRAAALAAATRVLGRYTSPLVMAATVALALVAGLDRRLRWTPLAVPLATQFAGIALAAAGVALVAWAIAANPFYAAPPAAQVRSGFVATAGPYRFVRHPHDLGTILVYVGFVCMLGSWWAWLPALAAAAAVVARTSREERVLRAGSVAYEVYAARTPWRLAPGLW